MQVLPRTQELEIKAAAIEKTIQEVLDKRAAKEKEVLKSQVIFYVILITSKVLTFNECE